jgi:hypothetical protein
MNKKLPTIPEEDPAKIKQPEQRSFLKSGESEVAHVSRVDLLTLLSQGGEDIPSITKAKRKKKIKSKFQLLSEHTQRLIDEMMNREEWKEARTFRILKIKNKK